MAYEWLGEVVMALSARGGGLFGPTILLLVLSVTLFSLLYYYSSLRAGNSKAAFVGCLLVIAPCMAFFKLRPQLLGYIFLLLLLIIMQLFRQGRRKAIWLLPPLFLLWINTHGTFAVGLFFFGVYLLCGWFEFSKGGVFAERWGPRERRLLLLAGVLCVLVLGITPYGLRLATYPINLALHQPINVATIQEWQPLSFTNPLGKVFLGLLLLFFPAQVVVGLRYRLDELIFLLFAAFAACTHVRFVIIFLIVFTPLLASLLALWIPRYNSSIDKPILNAALLAMLVLGMVHFVPGDSELIEMASQHYPLDAVAYLRYHPVPGPILNDYGFGGYLIYAMSPQLKVFIDGRADIYEANGVHAAYNSIFSLEPETQDLLRKYNIQACLIQRRSPLGTFLVATKEWDQVYADETSEVLVHNRRQSPEAVGPESNIKSDAPTLE